MVWGYGTLPDPEYEMIVRQRRLDTWFQPIVDGDNGQVVGFEALVRGPAGSRYAAPAALFAEAYRVGNVVELDWAARASACRAALAGGLPRQVMLFVNIEPLALDSPCPPDLAPDIDEAFAHYPIVLEVTERSLERDPRALLAGVDRQRGKVAGLAVDDVGSSVRQLPLLSALTPDVIKLDLTITQSHTSPTALSCLDFAFEQAERAGSALLAEGVETPEHARAAQAIGARLLQGHYLGRPEPAHGLLGDQADAFGELAVSRPVDVDTPLQAVTGQPVRRADRHLLVALMRHLIRTNVPSSGPAMLLLLVPDPAALAAVDGGFLTALAHRDVLIAAIGPGLPSPPAPDVRGGAIHEQALGGSWSAVLLASGVAIAVLAERRDGEPEHIDYAVTHDRDRVITAARCLLRQIGPS
ncbi:EAL domain-containing protein [Hamadaea sp. NPDC051192]|uniref:EAL domain-containing protein n=1 Tax=Hamadaea sp. NPDC051192 TaxID=3154940 RepID=UPI0034433817